MANIRSVKGPKSVEEVSEQRVSCNQFHNDRNHYALPEDTTKEGILKYRVSQNRCKACKIHGEI